jgi:averantin hydroxylase
MLSYIDSRALKAIYSHHNHATEGFSEMGKDPIEYQKSTNGSPHFLNAPQEDHSRFRKLFTHSFSERGMREMQPRIQNFVESLLKGLKEDAGSGGYADISLWYNWTTFDVIGDLAFGDSFHCLQTKTTSPWIEALYASVKALVFTMVIRLYGLEWLLPYLTPKRLSVLRYANLDYSSKKMMKRIEMGVDQNDFFDKAIAQSDFEKGTGMTRDEMVSNASILVLAGSETTATLLSGVTFLLCKHPQVLKKLNAEIRSAFTSEAEINLMSVSKLVYLLAVLDEALRIYPPAANPGSRVVPKQGSMILDKWVPGGVSNHASYCGPRSNFGQSATVNAFASVIA